VFLIQRSTAFVATLLAASALIFAVLALLPGSAVDVRLDTGATPEAAAALAQQLGLDQPPWVRYGRWLRGLASGDLGHSVAYDAPIAELLAERLLVTLPLALIAMAVTVVFALGLGVFAASRHRTSGSRSC
jgi:peptide/nickel transport system permease protein